jgi:hypothetical protein
MGQHEALEARSLEGVAGESTVIGMVSEHQLSAFWLTPSDQALDRLADRSGRLIIRFFNNGFGKRLSIVTA